MAKYYKDKFYVPEITYVGDYHDHPHYIHSLVRSVQRFREQNGSSEKLLFSFHGVPERFSQKGDPYEAQCRKTAELVVKELELKDSEYAIAFQSRFGKEEWVKPYTDELLTTWAKEGVKSVQVISPAFSADCLETLEELAIENRDTFIDNGGEDYHYIPALNDDRGHIELMLQLIEQRLLK